LLHLGLIIIGDLKSLIRLATNYLKIKMIKYAYEYQIKLENR